MSVIGHGAILSPQGVYTEYLDGVQVRTPDGVHTPAYVPGNVFVGHSSASVAYSFYGWLGPRIWPLIAASSPVTGPNPGSDASSAGATSSSASPPAPSAAGRS